MLANRHSEAVKNIISMFEKCGYNVSVTLVNAKDYGVAQERKRVFYIGFRKDLGVDFVFPHGSTEKAEDKTKEIAVTVSNKGDIYYNDKIITVSELETVLKNNPDKILNMFIDKTAPFQAFVHVVDVAKKERNGRFIISTDTAERK